ncbi:hypothetical protein AB0E08_03675 [Streptomyces sp. NPDC048281]|uniref:hypothetical protein n=1 Tax=Streptomyces sp. NPDC048281 TaxID=3154715 RepID=UPI003422ED72
MHVTEATATHAAVGVFGDPLNLRVTLYWRAEERGFLIVLKNEDMTEEYGAWQAQTEEPMAGETLPNLLLDRLVWVCLSPHRKGGKGESTDPASVAAHFSTEWGWDWTTERFAQPALKEGTA